MSDLGISLEALEILDAIDRRGSFASAAEELNKATSALSYGVQKMEEQLGIAVFVRRGRRSVLTPAGELLLKEGRMILAATQRTAAKARELATGWEPRLRLGLETVTRQESVFRALASFQTTHPTIEIDVCDTVLNGGWEALEHHRVDLLVGAPGPVPTHKGFRTIAMGPAGLIPVISKRHPKFLHFAPKAVADVDLGSFTRVVTHDTATTSVRRSKGLSLSNAPTLYVQTMEHKTLAILAGLGIGHLPRHRIEAELKAGLLVQLPLKPADAEGFIAWHTINKGKALQALITLLKKIDPQPMIF